MKNKTLLYLVFFPGLLFAFLWDCKKVPIKVAPTVTLTPITNITYNSATTGGDVTSDGGASVTAKGVCWATNQIPTPSDSKVNSGTGTGSFTSSLTGLNPGTTYTIRAFAYNSVEIGYSNQATFTTVALMLPVVTTTDISSISATAAASGGNITTDGGSAITARGVCWATTQNPTTSNSKTTDGTGSGMFTSTLTGLSLATTYYVKAYATNSIGTSYGGQVTFTTLTEAEAPVVTTTTVSTFTNTTATSGGNISSDGGSAITAKGVCWATTANPTISNSKTTDGTGSGSFTSNISGLTSGTTYYLRAYATNSIATSYGIEFSFTPGTVTDIDGNVYHYIAIGTQTWMVENLKTIHYRNGDPIPNVTGNTEWFALVTGAYCWYNNDAATYKAAYGALYNWFAVAESRNIAPTGWHVATDAEWTTLITFLGGQSMAGGKLKETGTAHWLTPNTGATNSTGFTALPGGYRDSGSFVDIGSTGNWWSSTGYDAIWAESLILYFNYDVANHGHGLKPYGRSVRCVRD